MATALTTPITKQAVSYELRRITVDLTVGDVHVEVALLDADGNVVEVRTINRTFAQLGINQATVDAIRTKIVDRLKLDMIVN